MLVISLTTLNVILTLEYIKLELILQDFHLVIFLNMSMEVYFFPKKKYLAIMKMVNL